MNSLNSSAGAGSLDPIDHGPEPNVDPDPSHLPYNSQPQQRRSRGFAATASSTDAGGGGKGKREREKEKERTKLRERHRRAITSRMLSGLRQYGNFPLPARADMNDVLAALAREAGWTVEADGTTYRQSPPTNQMAPYTTRSLESPLSSGSLKNCSVKAALDCQQSLLRIDDSLSPVSLDSVVIAESDTRNERYTSASPINSVGCLEADQLIHDVQSEDHRGNFAGSSYVPVYVMLSAGIINSFCQLVDPEGLRQELSHIKTSNIDGVIVNCWWGIIEAWNPQKYVWAGYRELFNIIKEFKLKLQVAMAFHENGPNESGGVVVSLPQWVLEIGKEKPDVFFTDREGRRNTEYLTWSIDKERVLHGRTAIEVYFDFMRSFRAEFDDLFTEGLISAVEVGLGPSGELKYPSCSERMGWTYPGIGEFQCYDKYSQQNLQKAAKSCGRSFWGKGPDNSGKYNSRPHETGFFRQRGDYDSYYGRFFLNWYSQILIEHVDNVLSLASLAFEDTRIVVKVPTIYWWCRTASHAAELTSGYYNPSNRDGYSPVFEVLKKHSVTVKLVCSGLRTPIEEVHDGALSDPEGLSWQILNAAWDKELCVSGENALSCFDREGCARIVEMAKPSNDPYNRHFIFFVYRQPSPLVRGAVCFSELVRFVKCMHGDAQCDLMG